MGKHVCMHTYECMSIYIHTIHSIYIHTQTFLCRKRIWSSIWMTVGTSWAWPMSGYVSFLLSLEMFDTGANVEIQETEAISTCGCCLVLKAVSAFEHWKAQIRYWSEQMNEVFLNISLVNICELLNTFIGVCWHMLVRANIVMVPLWAFGITELKISKD